MGIKPGDVVQLKSGGPAMTVKHQAQGGDWVCIWFDKSGELKSGTFPPESLNKEE